MYRILTQGILDLNILLNIVTQFFEFIKFYHVGVSVFHFIENALIATNLGSCELIREAKRSISERKKESIIVCYY